MTSVQQEMEALELFTISIALLTFLSWEIINSLIQVYWIAMDKKLSAVLNVLIMTKNSSSWKHYFQTNFQTHIKKSKLLLIKI
jgi:hypothetical protein